MGNESSHDITKMDSCYFITPIGEDGSDIRRQTEGLFDMVIEPVSNEFKMEALVAHKRNISGDITTEIINDIYKSKLVIADLTTLNPNVMYEVAIRDAMKKPIILIAEKGTKLPFDISTMNTIMYKNDFQGTKDLLNHLRERILRIDFENYIANNLITQSEAKLNLYNQVNSLGNPDLVGVLTKLLKEIDKMRISNNYSNEESKRKSEFYSNAYYSIEIIVNDESEVGNIGKVVTNVLTEFGVGGYDLYLGDKKKLKYNFFDVSHHDANMILQKVIAITGLNSDKVKLINVQGKRIYDL